MSKLDLQLIAGGYLDIDLLNENFTKINDWSNMAITRDGVTPNQMEADFDLNGNSLLNSNPDPTNPNSVPSLGQVLALIAQYSSGLVTQSQEKQTATPGQTAITLTNRAYQVGANNLSVFVNGFRLFAGVDYQEVSSTSVTLFSPLLGGEDIVLTVNDFYGTLTPAAFSVSWDSILGKPETATRWPAWTEVTGKPTTFVPSAHTHAASDITSGRLADARRGVYVQSGSPVGLGAGDAGALWFW